MRIGVNILKGSSDSLKFFVVIGSAFNSRLDEFYLCRQVDAHRLHGTRNDIKLLFECGVGAVESCDNSLELVVLVALHIVDGSSDILDSLLFAYIALIDGIDHVGEVVDYGDFHLVV